MANSKRYCYTCVYVYLCLPLFAVQAWLMFASSTYVVLTYECMCEIVCMYVCSEMYVCMYVCMYVVYVCSEIHAFFSIFVPFT